MPTQFNSIAQREAYSYVRSLAAVELPAAVDMPGADASQRDLRAFFEAFYAALYESPAQFGLPELEDDCISAADEGQNRTKKLAELNRKLQKPRETIIAALELLMQAGYKGQLAADPTTGEQILLLDAGDYLAILKENKIKKPFLSGLAGVGLAVTEFGECVALRSSRFPAMLPALKALATACTQAAACAQAADTADVARVNLAHFNFSRCDFRALDPNFHPSPLDLYRAFPPDDYARVARLHEYFTAAGYKPLFAIYAHFNWDIQYQGRRAVKGSPFLSIQYSERFENPLRVQMKCASGNRIAPLIARQPRELQVDFLKRSNTCNGDACNWCATRKHLGPSQIEVDGTHKTICWYVNPNIEPLTDDAVTLIQQYAAMHEELG